MTDDNDRDDPVDTTPDVDLADLPDEVPDEPVQETDE